MTAIGFGPAAVSTTPALETPDVLQTTSLFSQISQTDRLRIVAEAKIIHFQPNQILFHQGEPVKSLALIAKGNVKLLQANASGDEVFMWANSAGDVLGLMAGDRSLMHTCTACVLEAGKAWLWNPDQVDSLFRRYPPLASNLSRILSDRLRELEERFREVATEPVSRRIALALSRVVDGIGVVTEEGVDVRLSREELAQMTGTTLFTVSRVISRWAEQGFVRARRSAVLVTDRKMLQWVALRGD